MFSGIVEEAAQVVALQSDKGNLHLTMKCSFVNELKIDQSVAHNGVCLTVVSMTEDTYTVTAIKEISPPPDDSPLLGKSRIYLIPYLSIHSFLLYSVHRIFI